VLLIILVLLGIHFRCCRRQARDSRGSPAAARARDAREQAQTAATATAGAQGAGEPKIEPKIAMVKPPPIDERERARRKAQKQLNQVKDELAERALGVRSALTETDRFLVSSG